MMINDNDRKGIALVTVLWVVVLLIVIVASVSRNSRLDTKVCASQRERLRCRWGSRAGIDTAIAVLNEDEKESDSLRDLWSEGTDDLNDVPLEGCRFRVRIVDEASKLNINTATKSQLLWLPNMTEEIADAILDWRDDNDEPRPLGVEGGYYENQPYGYMIRNGKFRTIRELLLVRDMTERLLYGTAQSRAMQKNGSETIDETEIGWIEYLTCYSYDNNKDAAGEDRVNINEADENELVNSLSIKRSQAKWIVDNRSNNYRSISDLINKNSPKKKTERQTDEAEQVDMETFSEIADKITITGDERIPGRVNINTASKAVLATLLGGGETNEQIADDIITYREGLAAGMESIAELMDVSSVKIDKFKAIANYVTTRSDVFTIYSVATAERVGADGMSLAAEAVVDRAERPYNVVYLNQGVNN